jgi:hypothetical protein
MLAGLKWITAGLLVVAASIGTTSAGEIVLVSSIYSQSHPVPHLHYEGEVTLGDFEKIDAAIDQFVRCGTECLGPEGGSRAVLTLHSVGGNYLTGLQVADLIRREHIATVVETGMECYSACAFMFLGGSGYSSTPTIGPYVERMLEPGAVLGFHAPYYGDSEFKDAVVANGGAEVQSWARNDFALMVNELVRYNVDPLIMSTLVDVGPDDFFYVERGVDFYLMRIGVPPVDAGLFMPSAEEALRNACVRLIAAFDNFDPFIIDQVLPQAITPNTGTDEQGYPLTGYMLGTDMFGPGHCSMRQDDFADGGDASIAIYTADQPGYAMVDLSQPPVLETFSAPMFSMFSRQNGWSNAGPGGLVTGRRFQRGPLSHYFTPIDALVAEVASGATIPIRANRFYSVQLPALSSPVLGAVTVSETQHARTARIGDVWIFEQVGPLELFETAVAALGAQGVTLTNNGATTAGMVREGSYADGTPFVWTAFSDGTASALFRAEILKPEGVAATPEERALLGTILCQVSFNDLRNGC